MTTDTELRDLLAAEAGSPTGGSGGWEDVMRRGRRRQRLRRVRNSALVAGAVAAGLIVTAITLSTDETKVDTTPATQPTTAPSAEIDPSTVLQEEGARIPAARTQGNSVKLFLWDMPNVCDLRPVVVESDDRITVGLVDEEDPRGVPWADCGEALDGDFGTVELRAPVGDRPLVDLSTGRTVRVTDSADLLFPTSLPAPFDLEAFVEGNGLISRMDPVRDGSTFRFTADNFQYLYFSSSSDLEVNADRCDVGQEVEVRGAQGCFATDEDLGPTIADGEVLEPVGPVAGYLSWDENGRALLLSLALIDAGESSLDELLAIAEGLEPLRG